MNVPTFARLLATVIHAVAAEYRKLDAPPPAAAEPARQEMSCTSAQVRDRWQPQQEASRNVAAPRAFGFGRRG
jgi:hypothetical protein